jgi:hypothetical protein
LKPVCPEQRYGLYGKSRRFREYVFSNAKYTLKSNGLNSSSA